MRSEVAAPAPLSPGTVLSGRYRVVEAIGQSDLSRVYVAMDQRGRAEVALKVFEHSVLARSAALSEYQTQARLASSLDAFGIARAYDFGIDANSGLPFSTAERVNWASLDRRVAAQGPLDPASLSRALAVLARALDAAHVARLVHRDLKPQNVFISTENPEWVRITDFGIGAIRRELGEPPGFAGPPGYTPAEAANPSAQGEPGVDVFALGALAFFALTGGSPFRSLAGGRFDRAAHWAELNQPLDSLSQRAREFGVTLDPALDGWFARALAPDPGQRFESAGELSREFTRIAESAPARGGGPRTLPGIAAAIAQPLLFQPEPSAVSLGLSPPAPVVARPRTESSAGMSVPGVAGTGPAVRAALGDASPAGTPARPTPQPSNPGFTAGLPRRLPLAVWVAGAFALVAAVAVAGYALLNRDSGAAAPNAPASASASPPSVTPPPEVDPSGKPSSALAEPAPSASGTSTASPAPSTKPRAPARVKTRSAPAKAVPKAKAAPTKTTQKKCSGCK